MVDSVNINTIIINQMTTNNVLGNGTNHQFGWSSHQKQNYGYSTTGKNIELSHNSTVILDRDLFDGIFNDTDNMVGTMNQC